MGGRNRKPYFRVHILSSFGHAYSRAQSLAWLVTVSMAGGKWEVPHCMLLLLLLRDFATIIINGILFGVMQPWKCFLSWHTATVTNLLCDQTLTTKRLHIAKRVCVYMWGGGGGG